MNQAIATAREASWAPEYPFFSAVIEQRGFKVGTEVGVAFGGHSEAILRNTTVARLYGVDPYLHSTGDYSDPMNMLQPEFDELYDFVLARLSPFGERYVHIRKSSVEAIYDIPGKMDFVYIDANHTGMAVWQDLCAWFNKVRIGGLIGGHDYNHRDLPQVQRTVDSFFGCLGWAVQTCGITQWWVERKW